MEYTVEEEYAAQMRLQEKTMSMWADIFTNVVPKVLGEHFRKVMQERDAQIMAIFCEPTKKSAVNQVIDEIGMNYRAAKQDRGI